MPHPSHLVPVGVFLLLLLAPVARPAEVAPFEKGDRVVFLGDSIFHGGKVHSDLLLFQATRHPYAPISVINAGVAGDTATEAVRRLEWDVQPYNPSMTVVMFGMNDVGRWLYGQGTDTPTNLVQRQRLIDDHSANRDRIVNELRALGSRVVLCTPTPFDQYAQTEAGNAVGVDDALATIAAGARQLAAGKDLPLVDFHAGMLRVLHAQQAKDPAFTMMDAPRIHPTGSGHLLMAYLFLKAQNASPVVSTIAVDAAAAKVAEADNCSVGDVRRDGASLSFQSRARSLPYPIEHAEKIVLDWVPFTNDLNRETLRVTNLPSGRYDLLIDGESVGEYAADELASGINLATNTATPQYRQAADAMRVNEKRRARENNTLRIFAALEHDVLRPKGVDPADIPAVRAAMEQAIREETQKSSWRVGYFTNLSKVYYEQKPNHAKIEQELADLTAQVFRLCEPRAHRYELRETGN